MATPEPSLIVLYDGVCNLCNGSVNFIIDHDKDATFRFAPMQEPSGRALLDKYRLVDIDLSTFVLIEDGQPYLRSTAWMRIMAHLDGAWPALSAFRVVPRPLRDAVYDLIGANRYKWFGRQDVCRIPTEDTKGRFLEWRPGGRG